MGIFSFKINGTKLGITGALVLSLVYVLWGPDPRKSSKKSKGSPRGLINYGNYCYFNAVIQALAACNFFIFKLSSLSNINKEETPNKLVKKALLDLVNLINHHKETDEVSSVPLLNALRNHGWVINSAEQDAHELFDVLIKTIEEEENSPTSFSGKMKTKLVSKENPDPQFSTIDFTHVTLSLPESTSLGVRLEELLYIYTREENVEEKYLTSVKFQTLPDSIVFHIQRTAFSGYTPYKRNDSVKFLPYLSMTPYTLASENKTPKYVLHSVISHLGEINSGHYVTYRRGLRNSPNWLYVSDETVKTVSLQDVLNANPYMLFYEKEVELNLK